MRLIKFSYHLFCKNLLMSIIIIIQLVTSVLLLNDILATANRYFVTVDEYTDSGLSDINGIIVDSFGKKVPEWLLNELPDDSIAYCESGSIVYFEEYMLCGYSKEFVAEYVPDLSDGIWLSECDGNWHDVPVVIPQILSQYYDVGDTILINLENGIKGRVIGALKSSYYCSFNSGGTQLSTKNMMSNAEEKIQMPLLTLYDYLPKENVSYGTGQAIVLNDSDYIDDACQVFGDYYYVRTFSKVLENGINEAYARVRVLAPILLALSLVSLLGMVGCIAISTYKNLDFYSILYLCGASTIKCFMISLLYIAIYIFLTLTIFFVVFICVLHQRMCMLNWIAVITIVIILLSLSLITYRILKKNPPIEVFRDNK